MWIDQDGQLNVHFDDDIIRGEATDSANFPLEDKDGNLHWQQCVTE